MLKIAKWARLLAALATLDDRPRDLDGRLVTARPQWPCGSSGTRRVPIRRGCNR